MTDDELKQLIERGPNDQLVVALGPLTEAERKKLAKGVIAMRKELSRQRAAQNQQQGFPTFQQANAPSATRLGLALLALGQWTETQRIRAWHVAGWHGQAPDARDRLFRVLSDRKPDWLGKWADKELEDANFGDWEFVRSLIRAQLCPKPQGETYILRMLHGIRSLRDKQSLKDRLLSDPDLLDDEIWRIFELSPARGTILSSGDVTYLPHVDHPFFSWSRTLKALSAEGKLDRQRLLAASLGSLLRNTEARNTTWFAKFHELLEPTVEERETLQATYRQLLSHPVPAVVGLALDALSALETANKLDAAAFVASVAAVFQVQPKAQPMSAVRLLGRIARRREVPAATIAAAILPGLAHPAVNVQQALVDLLGILHVDAPEAIAAQLSEALPSLAPSVQEHARELARAPVSQSPALDSPAAEADILNEARLIGSPWREKAGIEAALRALDGTGPLTAVAFDSMAVPRLDPAQRVEPIRTLDELIERLTVALETLDDAIEFELLLDGISRLCDQQPPDFDARLAPLVQRSETMLHQGRLPGVSLLGLRSPLIKVMRHWCGRDTTKTSDDRDSILGVLDVRIGTLMLRLRDQRAAPLLACPTHRPGWIDPVEMLRRLQWYEQQGAEPSQHDFIQGCLRLAPDHRTQTLAQASALRGRFAAAFRYALGGPLEDESLSHSIFIAAGRARTPFAKLEDGGANGTPAGPDAIEPARYCWDASQANAEECCPSCGKPLRTPHARQFFACGADWHRQEREAGGALKHRMAWEAVVRVDVQQPPLPSEHMRDLPTVLLHAWLIPKDMGISAGDDRAVLRWLGHVWPANPDSYFAIGIRLRRMPYMIASTYRLRAPFLMPLFDPDVPFTEMAQLLLALALNQAEPEVTGLAVDALIELIRDGRCVGSELGGVLRVLLQQDYLKLNRLAKHLETAARASPLHAYVCAEVVQTTCSQLADIPKDLHHLLGPLLEWLTAGGQSVHSDLRPILTRVTTGKAGALAKRLLQLTPAPERGMQFLLDSLAGRLHRVRRWVAHNG
jgi:hypothetical protein